MPGFSMDGVNINMNGASNDAVMHPRETLSTDSSIQGNGFMSPKYSQYITCQSRYSSFKHWPKFLNPDKVDMAMAGFVYTGQGDQAFCFYCGIEVKDWEPKDNAYAEHWKHSPNCKFLIMCRVESRDTLYIRRNPNLFSHQSFTFGSAGMDVVDKNLGGKK